MPYMVDFQYLFIVYIKVLSNVLLSRIGINVINTVKDNKNVSMNEYIIMETCCEIMVPVKIFLHLSMD